MSRILVVLEIPLSFQISVKEIADVLAIARRLLMSLELPPNLIASSYIDHSAQSGGSMSLYDHWSSQQML